MIKTRSASLIVALCATWSGAAWGTIFETPDNLFHAKGDVIIGTMSTAVDPVYGNLTIHGRSSPTEPILRIRNAHLDKTLMSIDRFGLMTLGEALRPASDPVSLLHVKGPLAVWPNTAQSWPNTRASAVFAKDPENYLLLTIPGKTTSGFAVRFNNALSDESDRYKTFLAVQKGSIEFKTKVEHNVNWAGSGFVRMRIDADGRILGGDGLVATPGIASASQVVLGKFNDTRTNDATTAPAATDHTKGVFVVGAGTEGTRKNAIRVMNDGTVLVKTSGDISPGEFTNGPTP